MPNNRILEWFRFADADFATAEFLLNMHPQPLEQICYHCQQSAEKSLKAYLCANDIEVPKIHEVGVLCNQCSELNPNFTDLIKICEILEIYATHTRYPNRIEVTEHDAKQALEQASAVYNFVAELLKTTSD